MVIDPSITVAMSDDHRPNLDELRQQKFPFFITLNSCDLFREKNVGCESWLGRCAYLPELPNKNKYAEHILFEGFRALVWLNERPRKPNEHGRGLTAAVEFGSMEQQDRCAQVIAAEFFDPPIGKEILDAHQGDGSFISKIAGSRGSYIRPIWDCEADLLLSAYRKALHDNQKNQNPDPSDPQNLEKTEDTISQVVQRSKQGVFRAALLNE